MDSLGSPFSLISMDFANKINILLDFLKGENKVHYLTIQSMVEYEINYGLVDFETNLLTNKLVDKHPESGCRTLLRLHRALRWLHLFLASLIEEKDRQPSELCSEAYSELLARHHDSAQQKAAETAFALLPERTKFYEVLNAGSQEQVASVLGETLPLMHDVCKITETLYYKYELLELP